MELEERESLSESERMSARRIEVLLYSGRRAVCSAPRRKVSRENVTDEERTGIQEEGRWARAGRVVEVEGRG